MSQPSPLFFKTPIRYLRWVSVNKPAYFYSTMVGLAGPGTMVIAPPIRRFFGDDAPRARIPLTYPIPKGPRSRPTGFDDE